MLKLITINKALFLYRIVLKAGNKKQQNKKREKKALQLV